MSQSTITILPVPSAPRDQHMLPQPPKRPLPPDSILGLISRPGAQHILDHPRFVAGPLRRRLRHLLRLVTLALTL